MTYIKTQYNNIFIKDDRMDICIGFQIYISPNIIITAFCSLNQTQQCTLCPNYLNLLVRQLFIPRQKKTAALHRPRPLITAAWIVTSLNHRLFSFVNQSARWLSSFSFDGRSKTLGFMSCNKPLCGSPHRASIRLCSRDCCTIQIHTITYMIPHNGSIVLQYCDVGLLAIGSRFVHIRPSEYDTN